MRIGQVQYPLILWWATTVHTGLGLAILIDSKASSALLLAGLQDSEEYLGTTLLGLMLLSFSALAAYGLYWEHKRSKTFVITCLFPQFVLLISSFMSNILILINGYDNSMGMPIPRAIIFVALWPVLAGAILHTIGIVERYFWKWSMNSPSQQ